MITIIAATDEKGGIGKNGTIPWNIPEEMEHFRVTTKGSIVIVGRKTFETINNGKGLKGRTNIVLTRNERYKSTYLVFNTITEALYSVDALGKEVYVIGGCEIYNEFLLMDLVDKMIITTIMGDYNCDIFFPIFDAKKFTDISYEYHPESEFNEIPFIITTYSRE